MLVAVQAVLALGQEQGDVGVVGTGHLVAHEHAGIGIDQADALVVADLAFDRLGPEADHAAGMRATARRRWH